MVKLVEEIAIDANPQQVFDVITDFSAYARWNPWVVRAEGDAREDGAVVVRAKLGARVIKVHHRILVFRPGVEFRWCDKGWFTALAYGQRARFLEARGAGTHYRVELTVTGLMAGFVGKTMGRALREGLLAETVALKKRVEEIASARPLRAVS